MESNEKTTFEDVSKEFEYASKELDREFTKLTNNYIYEMEGIFRKYTTENNIDFSNSVKSCLLNHAAKYATFRLIQLVSKLSNTDDYENFYKILREVKQIISYANQ